MEKRAVRKGFGLEAICKVYGYSRTAYYKCVRKDLERQKESERVLREVRAIRKDQPRAGGKKLHRHIRSELKSEGIGRDRLFDLLRQKDLLIKRKKSYRKTTDSRHSFRKYGNLIKDKAVWKERDVVASDITYIETEEGFCYLSLITHLSSRKIVGWELSRDLRMEGSLKALIKAVRQFPETRGMIHHSDRGVQYCCHKYVDYLKDRGIQVSMTEEDHVYENAHAERVNGILKEEFGLGARLSTYEVARKMVKQAVKTYNEKRLHMSLNYQTPAQVFAA